MCFEKEYIVLVTYLCKMHCVYKKHVYTNNDVCQLTNIYNLVIARVLKKYILCL